MDQKQHLSVLFTMSFQFRCAILHNNGDERESDLAVVHWSVTDWITQSCIVSGWSSCGHRQGLSIGPGAIVEFLPSPSLRVVVTSLVGTFVVAFIQSRRVDNPLALAWKRS